MLENSLSKKKKQFSQGKYVRKRHQSSNEQKNDQSVFSQIKKTHDLLSELLQKKQTLQQACFLTDVNEEVTHVRHIHETLQDSCSSMESVTFLRCPLNNDTIILFGSGVRRTDGKSLCESPAQLHKRSWRFRNLREKPEAETVL